MGSEGSGQLERSIVEDGHVRFQWEAEDKYCWIKVDEDEDEDEELMDDRGADDSRDIENDVRGAVLFHDSAYRHMVKCEGGKGYVAAVETWWGAREHMLELQDELQGYIEDADADSADSA